MSEDLQARWVRMQGTVGQRIFVWYGAQIVPDLVGWQLGLYQRERARGRHGRR